MVDDAVAVAGTRTPVRGRIGYFYWNTIRNCGDAINAYILRDVVGVEGVPRSGARPHILGIGSILQSANAHSAIWGSGLIRPDAPMVRLGAGQVRALRGTRTRDRLRETGVAVPDVPLGDPGIFCARLLGDAPRTLRYRAAVVPHHASWSKPFFAALRQRDDIVVIDMMDDSLRPLDLIAQSEVVLSQSLHGLVFAEALGKPNLWITETGSPVWTFKFEDWFTTTAEPQTAPARIPFDLDEACRMAAIRGSTIRQDEILAAFPEELVEPLPDTPQVPFDAGRAGAPLVIMLDKPLGQDGEDFAATAAVVRGARAAAMARFVEPVYCALLPQALAGRVDRAVLLRAMRHLDTHGRSDFVWFPLEAGQGGTSTEFVVTPATDGWNLPPGGVLLRPPGRFAPNTIHSRHVA